MRGRLLIADESGLSVVKGLSCLPGGSSAPGEAAGDPAGGSTAPESLRLERLAGGGEPGHADGAWAAARFRSPRALRVAPDGTIYLLDTGNHVLRRLTPDGRVETVAGAAGTEGEADGLGAQARFSGPLGLALLPGGDLAVADTGNQRLCRVTPGGRVSTLAGGRAVRNVDGPVPGFSRLAALDVDAAGNLYVAENLADSMAVVRRLSPDGARGSTLAGGLSYGTVDGISHWAGVSDVTGLAVRPDGRMIHVAQQAAVRLLWPVADALEAAAAASPAP